MIIRFTALSCVPLFLLLTGYLNTKKDISKKYYKGIIPILISYVLISLTEIIASSVYNRTSIAFGEVMIKILNFSANTYAWYVEMYIGLFLVIPFLNILYENLDNTQKKVLVSVLIFLTLLPQVFKSFIVYGHYLDIFTDYWQIIYPITYFYIGKLIREFNPKFAYYKRFIMLIIAITIPCSFCYIFSTSTQFAWYVFNGFDALTNAFIAISIFLLLYDADVNNTFIQKIVSEIAICSFEMYLFSSIWDKYLYGKYNFNMFVMVVMVAITTYCSSKILRFSKLIAKKFLEHRKLEGKNEKR